MSRKRGELDQPILDAATDLFLVEGYAGTHMTRVAEVAGVSLATLYRYFESKDDLLDQAFRREAERIESPWFGASWVAPDEPGALGRFAIALRGHARAWARSDRALGLLLTMAETPGLLYRFFLDRVEEYEHWIGRTLGQHLNDRRWITTHATVSASGFYSVMIRWGRGRLMPGQPDLPRRVPDELPDSGRAYHVARACDFDADELADWYVEMSLRAFGIPTDTVEALMREARSAGWRAPTPTSEPAVRT